MKIEKTTVYGFIPAFRGMRNPMNSWDRSDTDWSKPQADWGDFTDAPLVIGPEDLKLARKLIKAGGEHRKFVRMIQAWVDITIPRYVWTEFDTYKIGVTRSSCSTMHKLGTKDLDKSDFQDGNVLQGTLDVLNLFGAAYRDTKDYQYVRKIKQILPEGFLQKATINLNYEVAQNMLHQRKNHRLFEWSLSAKDEMDELEQSLCDWIVTLPHFMEMFNED